jgi:hypothetical protein
MSVPKILERLKDWRAGSNFRDFLIDQVKNKLPLSETALEQLYKRAGLGETPNQGEHSRDLHNFSDAPPYLAEPQPDEQAKSMSSIILDAAKRIDDRVPRDKPIVLLGRDMWTVLPLLRSRGRDVQYFLWSRDQINDKATAIQWQKEVPPNTTVIDTGYGGSIIDNIKRTDASATGFLLSRSASSRYPQLLKGDDHSSKVFKIEEHPKLISSGQTYTKNGAAVTSRGGLSAADAQSNRNRSSGQHRYLIESNLRQLFRASGLDTWSAWRYSQYLGLKPIERLGVNSEAEVQEHYRTVAQLRSSSQ